MAVTIFNNESENRLKQSAHRDILCDLYCNAERKLTINTTNRLNDNDDIVDIKFDIRIRAGGNSIYNDNSEVVVVVEPVITIYNGTTVVTTINPPNLPYKDENGSSYKGYTVKAQGVVPDYGTTHDVKFTVSIPSYYAKASYTCKVWIKMRGIQYKDPLFGDPGWRTTFSSVTRETTINLPIYRIKKAYLRFIAGNSSTYEFNTSSYNNIENGNHYIDVLMMTEDNVDILKPNLLLYSSGTYKISRKGYRVGNIEDTKGYWEVTTNGVKRSYVEGLQAVTLPSCIKQGLLTQNFEINNAIPVITLYPMFRHTVLTINYSSDNGVIDEVVTYNSNTTLTGNFLKQYNNAYKEYYNCKSTTYSTSKGKTINWTTPVSESGTTITDVLQLARALGANIDYNDDTVTLNIIWSLNKLYISYNGGAPNTSYTYNGSSKNSLFTYKSDGVTVKNANNSGFNSIKLLSSDILELVGDGYKIERPLDKLVRKWVATTGKELNWGMNYSIPNLITDAGLDLSVIKDSDYTLELTSKWYPNILTLKLDFGKFQYKPDKTKTFDVLTYAYGDVDNLVSPYTVTSNFDKLGYRIITREAWFNEDSQRTYNLSFNWTQSQVWSELDIEESIKVQDVSTTLTLKHEPIKFSITYVSNESDTEAIIVDKTPTEIFKGTTSVTVKYEYDQDILISETVTANRPGYKINKWVTNKGMYLGNNLKNIISMHNGTLTLYADWEPLKYSIYYHADDGSIPYKQFVTFAEKYVEDQNGTQIEAKVFNNGQVETYINKQFYSVDGWSSTADEASRQIDVQVNDDLSDGLGNNGTKPTYTGKPNDYDSIVFHLYPVWKDTIYNKYYIYYTHNDKRQYTQTVQVDGVNNFDIKLIPFNTLDVEKAGYAFDGWYIKRINADNTVNYLQSDGKTWSELKDTSLLMKWEDQKIITGIYPYDFNITLEPAWLMQGHIFVKVEEDVQGVKITKWVPAIVYVRKTTNQQWVLSDATYVKVNGQWKPTVI